MLISLYLRFCENRQNRLASPTKPAIDKELTTRFSLAFSAFVSRVFSAIDITPQNPELNKAPRMSGEVKNTGETKTKRDFFRFLCIFELSILSIILL